MEAKIDTHRCCFGVLNTIGSAVYACVRSFVCVCVFFALTRDVVVCVISFFFARAFDVCVTYACVFFVCVCV